jgi:hypothetical protein
MNAPVESIDPAYDRVLGRVIQIVSAFTGIAADRISENSDLRRDLGIEGDDANELIERVCSEFVIDMACYDPGDFFWPEGGADPLRGLLHLARRGLGLARAKVPLSVGALARIALRGVWPELRNMRTFEASPRLEKG